MRINLLFHNMSGKKMSISLGVLLVIIWGVVAWFIFEKLRQEPVSNQQEIDNIIPVDSIFTEKIQFELLLNYKDPFLKESKVSIKETLPKAINTSPLKTNSIESKVTDAKRPNLTYHGIIMNLDKGKSIGVMTLNEMEYLIEEGQTTGGVSIVKISENEIITSFNQELTTIKKQGNE